MIICLCTTNIINLLFSKCTHTCPAALVLDLPNQQTHGNILCYLQGPTQHIPQFEEMKLTPRIFFWPCHRANSQAISYLVAEIQLETHMAYMKLLQVAQYFLYTICVKCLPLSVTEPAQHIALASSPFWDSSSWNRGQTEWNRQKMLQTAWTDTVYVMFPTTAHDLLRENLAHPVNFLFFFDC